MHVTSAYTYSQSNAQVDNTHKPAPVKRSATRAYNRLVQAKLGVHAHSRQLSDRQILFAAFSAQPSGILANTGSNPLTQNAPLLRRSLRVHIYKARSSVRN